MIDESTLKRLRAQARAKNKRLTPDTIAALLERVANGDPYEKVAADFGCSLGTVRNHVKRALRDQ